MNVNIFGSISNEFSGVGPLECVMQSAFGENVHLTASGPIQSAAKNQISLAHKPIDVYIRVGLVVSFIQL